jgi:hypothetical protein
MSIALPSKSVLPTHLDLPYKDDKPVENDYQPEQSALLTSSLIPHLDRLHPDGMYHTSSDNGIYWDLKDPPLDGCRAPDWYYVPGVSQMLNGVIRNSYVIWQEKVRPLLVMEYVSGTGKEERDDTPEKGKFWVYEQGIKARYYLIYDFKRKRLDLFKLSRGRYRKLEPGANERFRVPEMELEWGIWNGEYHKYQTNWLRAWDMKGNLLLAPEEREADAKQRTGSEKQRADKLAAKLRQLGVDPDAL